MTKTEQVLMIVNWEHRYKLGKLQGGEWCLNRVRELMRLPATAVADLHWETFNYGPKESAKNVLET